MDSCNFFLASPMYRVLVTSVAAVTWNCYISLLQHENTWLPAPRPPSCGGKLEQDVVDALVRCLEKNPRRNDQDDQNIRDCIGEVVDLLDFQKQLRETATLAAQ